MVPEVPEVPKVREVPRVPEGRVDRRGLFYRVKNGKMFNESCYEAVRGLHRRPTRC